MNISPRLKAAAVWGLLALLIASYVVIVPWSGTHLDHSRDMRAGADVADGLLFPLLGPRLAGLFQIGPAWYYLLGGLQAFGLGYLGTQLALALLAAVQFPLAYLAGKAVAGRAAGLLWAILLIVPAWSMLEQVLPGHTILSGVCVTAMLWLAVRYLKFGRAVDFVLMALFFSLALHAQLAALPLGVLPLICAIVGWTRHRLSWQASTLAGLVAFAPFAPFVIDQILHGWTIFGSVGEYFEQTQGEGRITNAIPLLWQLAGGGLVYWFEVIVGLSHATALYIALVFSALCALGVTGAIVRCARGDRLTLILLASLVAAVIGLALLRSFQTYFMTTALQVLFLGVVATGLSVWLRHWRAPALAACAALCLALYWVAAAAAVNHQRLGTWPFAFFPLFNVIDDWHEHRPYPFMTAAGVDASGRWLCANPDVVIHGSYAHRLIMDHGIDARLACNHNQVRAGGVAPDAEHWLGLTRGMLRGTGREASHKFGSFRMLPVRGVLGETETVILPVRRVSGSLQAADLAYPPLGDLYGQPMRRQVLEIALAQDEWLAVTQLSFGMAPAPEVSLWCGEREIRPLNQDRVSWVFDNGNCEASLQLEIAAADPQHLDIVVF